MLAAAASIPLASFRVRIMPPRSSWKGYLNLSLVSVPVKAYTATNSSSAGISLNQLHGGDCNRRIRYQKVCPEHGEVKASEIVSGYEYAKGQYVVIDPEEIQKLRPSGADKAIKLDAFVPSGSVDPVYHSGKTYYLLPDGAMGQKPYRLIHDALKSEELQGVGKVVISQRERVVLIRPIDNLIGMTLLEYAAAVKQPAGFEDELTDVAVSDAEAELTGQLMRGLVQQEFDFEQYRDPYTDQLQELIEAKIEGREIVAPPEQDQPQVINLMDALKASVQQIAVPEEAPKKVQAKSAARKTSKKAAKSTKKASAKGTAKKAAKKSSGKRKTG